MDSPPSSSGLSFSIDDASQLLDLSGGLPSNEVDDLSLSDLSLDQTIRARAPFSLLSKPTPPPRADVKTSRLLTEEDEQGGSDLGEEYSDTNNHRDQAAESEDEETARRKAAKMREEKLQSDIFVLKKLNAAFSSFNEALDDAGSANQRVAAQLAETDALLNKYVGMLSKTEEFSRLVFDDEWYGAEADEEQIERERIEQEQREIQAARERELAAQREAERLEREEQERLDKEERQRLEAEKRERAPARGGVRGVRGTRASMRGAAARTAVPPRPASSSSSSSIARPRASVAPGAPGSGIPVKRGTPTGTTTGRGTNTRGGLTRRP